VSASDIASGATTGGTSGGSTSSSPSSSSGVALPPMAPLPPAGGSGAAPGGAVTSPVR